MTGTPGPALGVDLGDARIGIAVTDASGLAARPLEPLERIGPRRDPRRVAELAREHGVATVVVGLPLEMSGEDGERAVAARRFVARLRGHLRGVRVELQDERLTTVSAERAMIEADVSRDRRRQQVDGIAAAIIVRAWLDAHPGGSCDEA